MFNTRATKKVDAFQIRIIYKNGVCQDFWVTEFSVTNNGMGNRSFQWKPAFSHLKPIFMGVDEIIAVWQVNQTKIEVPDDPNEGAQP
jgi:hypothetical protein